MSDRKFVKGNLPSRLPLVGLPNEVLLPTVVAHIKISTLSKSSGGLVQHLSASGADPPYVAVVPLLSNQQGTDDSQDEDNMEGLHGFGTIAQVNGMGYMIKAGVTTMAIEGIARIQVSHNKKSPCGNFHTVEFKFPDPDVRTRLSNFFLRKKEQYEDELKELFTMTKFLLELIIQQHGELTTGSAVRGLEVMEPSRAVDTIIGFLASTTKAKLEALEAVEYSMRIKLALRLVKTASESLRDSPRVQQSKISLIQGAGNKTKPMAMLRKVEQDTSDKKDEIDDLLLRIRTPGAPEEVVRVAEREATRLRKLGEYNPSYAMARSYLEVLADLPWRSFTKEASLTLAETRKILDSVHYGLEKVKDRLVQHVAVQKLRGSDIQSPILCFVGPPGVGKTSLAKSVADVLSKPFVRISLGGVRDEAEIRGHRRTYIGAMPGRILNGIRRVGVRDPVVLLDEVDKMGHDVRGDPSSALLEVLDPEQNHSFVDTYVALPFDLSKVVFIATANRAADIPPPLLDRLEVIKLPGYTVGEKMMIAQKHLLPKVLRQHGLKNNSKPVHSEALFSEDVMRHVIVGYTREAGVRGLERCLAAVCRYCAVGIISDQEANSSTTDKEDCAQQEGIDVCKGASPALVIPSSHLHSDKRPEPLLASFDHPSVLGPHSDSTHNSAKGTHILDGRHVASGNYVADKKLIEIVLGPPKYLHLEETQKISEPGVAAGLVWTPAGGLVQYIECCCTSRGQPGRIGQLTLTGQLGDVLEESARIALSWIRSNASKLALAGSHSKLSKDRSGGAPRDSSADEIVPVLNWDFHVHLPSGGIPKDGPSAGVTIACALLSLLSGKTLRADTAMTGELTLRGIVLPVGGVKEKCLAAHQAGLTRVLLPSDNIPNMKAEVSQEIQKDLQIVGVKHLSEVIACAFEPPLSMLVQSSL